MTDFIIIEAEDTSTFSFEDEISSRKTTRYMTEYEYTRLLQARALQISAGSDPLVDNEGIYDPIEIAKMEIEKRVIPLYVERILPNGIKELWSVRDMVIHY